MPMDSIKHIAGLMDSVQRVIRDFKHNEVWWRGQPQSGKPLIPSAYRDERGWNWEQSSTTKFQRAARTRYSNCPSSDEDYPQWLFLMQHYGLPTRLLDWTESPLIATFFAVKDESESDGELWALNPYALNTSQIKMPILVSTRHVELQTLLRAPFFLGAEQEEKVVAISTTEVDIRMLVQLSTFTIHGTLKPLDQLEDANSFLHKFTIPANAKEILKRDLYNIGIRDHNLFPDLEHLAAYLKQFSYPY